MTDANTTHSNPLSTPLSPLQGKVALITGGGPGHWPRHCLFAGKARCLDCGSGKNAE